MPGKLNLYNLGSLGVDLNTSPIHRPDGSWTLLQNGEFNPIGEEGAVKKRGSSNRINSSALAGEVLRMKNIPLDTAAFGTGGGGGGSIFALPMLFGVNPDNPLTGNALWMQSDGTTFSALATSFISVPSVLQAVTFPEEQRFTIVRFGTVMFFVSRGNDSDEAPKLYAYDGATQSLRLSPFPTLDGTPAGADTYVSQLLVANGSIYCALRYTSNDIGVFQYNVSNGTITQVGNTLSLLVSNGSCGLAWAFGTLFLGVNPGFIYRLDNGVWTIEMTNATIGQAIEFSAVWPANGRLFAALAAISPPSAVGAIYWRDGNTPPASAWTSPTYESTNANTWTDGTGTDALSGKFGRFVSVGTSLYCLYRDPATYKALVYVDETLGWQEDEDLAASLSLVDADEPGNAVVLSGAIYWPVMRGTSGFILKRASNGTYTKEQSGVNFQGTAGLIGVTS